MLLWPGGLIVIQVRTPACIAIIIRLRNNYAKSGEWKFNRIQLSSRYAKRAITTPTSFSSFKFVAFHVHRSSCEISISQSSQSTIKESTVERFRTGSKQMLPRIIAKHDANQLANRGFRWMFYFLVALGSWLDRPTPIHHRMSVSRKSRFFSPLINLSFAHILSENNF